MPDVTTTITYTERFFHDVGLHYGVSKTAAAQPDFATYQEAVEDAARHGVASFEIRKLYVKVAA